VTGAVKRLDISLTHTKTGVMCNRSRETLRYLTDWLRSHMTPVLVCVSEISKRFMAPVTRDTSFSMC
jgi:hypothetical protein